MKHGVKGLVFAGGAWLAAAAAPASAALVINPTYDPGLSASAQTVIANALVFYQSTFVDPISVNLKFYNMNTGLGSSLSFVATVSYAAYRAALGADATSANDATALVNTPGGATNPVTGSGFINVKTANARAVGFSVSPGTLSAPGTPCDGYTGDSCIGLNLSDTNDATFGATGRHSLITVVQHEIDEALGLGSSLRKGTTQTNPAAEDLFRFASAGVRSFANNACGSEPAAFFSIDGGTTNLNQFNNCDNGGDYGDWVTHTPTQVQDAFTNNSGSPFLTALSTETVALDVVGYDLAATSPVPEPASMALFGAGLAGLGFLRRKRG